MGWEFPIYFSSTVDIYTKVIESLVNEKIRREAEKHTG